jgi:uncharacterized membrane protein
MINFIGNIKALPVIKERKWATLLLICLYFIILGAFVTRYMVHEGMIREGAAENQVFSDKTFLMTVFLRRWEYKGNETPC